MQVDAAVRAADAKPNRHVFQIGGKPVDSRRILRRFTRPIAPERKVYLRGLWLAHSLEEDAGGDRVRAERAGPAALQHQAPRRQCIRSRVRRHGMVRFSARTNSPPCTHSEFDRQHDARPGATLTCTKCADDGLRVTLDWTRNSQFLERVMRSRVSSRWSGSR
jgi:hypothetical protein